MNGETFKVGEVAIIACDSWPKFPRGSEVTILEIAAPPGDPMEYCIDHLTYEAPGLTVTIQCCVARGELRKRRPPQDWVKLCELDSVPADKPREVVT